MALGNARGYIMKSLIILSLASFVVTGCASGAGARSGQAQSVHDVDVVTRDNEQSAGDPTGFGMEGNIRTSESGKAAAQRNTNGNLHAHPKRSVPVHHEEEERDPPELPPGL